MKFQVYLREIQAMLLFASEDDSRRVICGLHFEVSVDRILIISTDGRRMAVLKSECDGDNAFTKPFEVTIPSSLFGELISSDGVERIATIVVSDDKTASVSVQIANELTVCATGPVIDEKYPSWRNVFPSPLKSAPTDRLTLSASYLNSFSVAFDILAPGKWGHCRVHFSGKITDPIVIMPPMKNFVGLLMGVRDEDEPSQYPGWMATL